MDIKRLLMVVLIILMLIAIVATLFGGNSSSPISLNPKEDVSIAVTGDVMFARKMPNVLSIAEYRPFRQCHNRMRDYLPGKR